MPPDLGIAVSGGGFRAAFYALGAFRYLAEAGHFPRLKVVSAVSGGSIAAGMLADRWQAGGGLNEFLAAVDTPFRQKVTKSNLRNAWLRRALLHPFAGRGDALAHMLADQLYEHERVRDLPPGPQVIFTSTDLGAGRAFRMSRDFVGSYDYHYVEPAPESIGLGIAVASSAAFPGSVSVVWLKTDGLGLTNPPPVLSLVDGGVYDNLGLDWFQRSGPDRPKSSVEVGFVLVVNASGLLHPVDSKVGSLRSIFRDQSVQYNQTVNVRIRWFMDKLLTGGLDGRKGAYIGIRHDPRGYKDVHGKAIPAEFYSGALPSSLVDPLALLRTDLDRFLPEEADLLSYHAYWSLHARLKTVAPDLAVADPAWRDYADMDPGEAKRLEALLRKGAKRALSR